MAHRVRVRLGLGLGLGFVDIRVRVSVRVSVVYAKVYNLSCSAQRSHYIVIEYPLSVMCRTWVSVPSLIWHGLD